MPDEIKIVSPNAAAKAEHEKDIAALTDWQAKVAAPNPKHTLIPPTPSVAKPTKPEEKK
jgi:hypothetical protein